VIVQDHNCILTSVDGVHDNVVVMKPPMVFDCADADEFVAALGAALRSLAGVDLATVQHTPT
jgi:ethanolamine-phosphate phospho-lyase